MYVVPSVFQIKIRIRTDLAFLDLEPVLDPSIGYVLGNNNTLHRPTFSEDLPPVFRIRDILIQIRIHILESVLWITDTDPFQTLLFLNNRNHGLSYFLLLVAENPDPPKHWLPYKAMKIHTTT